ncbi:MAG: PAS domain S-box protein [Pseudomonadota bacterium]|nr:PAS domain S-box protein [Pseudomonadota bacterium]
MMDHSGEEASPRKLIVGIGASAGGLQAFTAFFANLRPDSGMAFVVIQHLSPDHRSLLPEILDRAGPIPVVEAQHDMQVEPNHVYVIPSDATLTIENSRLVVVKPAPPRSNRRPIDSFFMSLAKDQGENAVSIILSGVGSDGSMGLAAVKESGGLSMAQAEFDHHALPGMPQSAAATGHVDYVLGVEDMPAKLIDYRDHLALVADRLDSDGTRIDAAEHLATVLSVLRAKTGHDFAQYKTKTVTRRIQWRMQVLQADTVPAYIKHLRQDPTEPELLFRDILIGVTEFFRDAEAYLGLSAALQSLIERRTPGQSLRVWVPACSTGEEVYSLAITIKELLVAQDSNVDVQIFGTDIDDRAIEYARAGRYRRTTGISPEQLQRWFFQVDGYYLPVRQIRSMCVFSVHNLIKDSPFSKLDLISCRNLLIYMHNDLQNRILRSFHWALNPQGLLFLGSSEGVSGHTDLFTVQNKAAHLFLRLDADAAFLNMPIPVQPPAAAFPLADVAGRGSGDRVDRSVRVALAKISPVFIVVDRQSNIVRYSGGEVAPYLEPSAGVASLGLSSNLLKSLRSVVRTALQSVMKTREGAAIENVSIFVEGQQRLISVIVEPVLNTGGQELYAVAFQIMRTTAPGSSLAADAGAADAEPAASAQELQTTRAQLHTTIGELETANEEMKSAAEEYQSVNEELQSTNEELQTSKEEMQSINEELQTVNAEMMVKNDLLSNLNNDLQNLLDSTQIATIFLDENLRIKNFTPGMMDIFSLRDTDKGRPLTDIVSLIAYEELKRDVAKVLRELVVIERELELHDRGSSFVMRIRPYRSFDRVVDGVVLTFVDVTAQKAAKRILDVTERRFTAIVNQAAVGVTETDLTGRILLTNAAFENMTGRSADDLKKMRWHDLIDPADAGALIERFGQAISDGNSFEVEYRLLSADGTSVWVHDSLSIVEDTVGRSSRVTSVTMDIDQRKRAAEQTELLMGELDHRVKNILSIVSSIITQTLKSTPSPEVFKATIEGRILAIARAHSLLTRHGADSPGTLRDLVETELEPYRGREIRVKGPDVVLTPKCGLSIALAFHELASNAAKYGSLSNSKGRLSVLWTVTSGPKRRLRVRWTESGGPLISVPPSQRGFGTTLIERSLGHEFEAKVSRRFAATGVVCTIDLPFTEDVGEFQTSKPPEE